MVIAFGGTQEEEKQTEAHCQEQKGRSFYSWSLENSTSLISKSSTTAKMSISIIVPFRVSSEERK